MDGNKFKLNIAHFYPNSLDMYGEWGNVLTLKKRCEFRGIDCFVDTINIGDFVDITKYDIYFFGSGQEAQLSIVAQELQKHKSALQEVCDDNAVFLGISEGFYLLGNYYLQSNNSKIMGLGLLDMYTTVENERFSGNVTAKIDFLIPNTIVGFENHNTKIYLQNELKPFATISVGNGNNGKDKTEGARYKNIFGTNLHGPILPKNSHFADYLIEQALKRKYKDDIRLEKIDDEFEKNAHIALINKAY